MGFSGGGVVVCFFAIEGFGFCVLLVNESEIGFSFRSIKQLLNYSTYSTQMELASLWKF